MCDGILDSTGLCRFAFDVRPERPPDSLSVVGPSHTPFPPPQPPHHPRPHPARTAAARVRWRRDEGGEGILSRVGIERQVSATGSVAGVERGRSVGWTGAPPPSPPSLPLAGSGGRPFGDGEGVAAGVAGATP